MFVVEIGFVITAGLLLHLPRPGSLAQAPTPLAMCGPTAPFTIVCVILFVTVLFANFAEAVAEGRGKAQAASLKKTQKDTEARRQGRGRQRDHRLLQRAEEGRRGPGQRLKRGHPQRRRGH